MRFLFIVQGEGRGHMTQAISLSQMLRNANHEVCHVIVGKSPRRKIPAFFYDRIKSPVTELESPNFVTDKKNKSVKPLRSFVQSVLKTTNYQRSITAIGRIVKEKQPDGIINFYDFLGGLYNFYQRPKAKFICIAHQYLMAHQDFQFPRGRNLDRTSLQVANKITSFGADRILALSFRPMADATKKKVYVVPPLIRQEVKDLPVSQGKSILLYMVNPGYGEEVEKFHRTFPEVSLDCFWDMKDKPEVWKVDETLTFHQLSDHKFLDKMSKCAGYITTAGFESVCEAMYLGKPAMMIPVKGHYEQACNAIDAENAGAGIGNDSFDIRKLVDYIPKHQDTSSWFRPWANSNEKVFIEKLTRW